MSYSSGAFRVDGPCDPRVGTSEISDFYLLTDIYRTEGGGAGVTDKSLTSCSLRRPPSRPRPPTVTRGVGVGYSDRSSCVRRVVRSRLVSGSPQDPPSRTPTHTTIPAHVLIYSIIYQSRSRHDPCTIHDLFTTDNKSFLRLGKGSGSFTDSWERHATRGY